MQKTLSLIIVLVVVLFANICLGSDEFVDVPAIKGDGLVQIAERYCYSPVKFIDLNRGELRNPRRPDLIYPGQKFRIPLEHFKKSALVKKHEVQSCEIKNISEDSQVISGRFLKMGFLLSTISVSFGAGVVLVVTFLAILGLNVRRGFGGVVESDEYARKSITAKPENSAVSGELEEEIIDLRLEDIVTVEEIIDLELEDIIPDYYVGFSGNKYVLFDNLCEPMIAKRALIGAVCFAIIFENGKLPKFSGTLPYDDNISLFPEEIALLESLVASFA